ncbi:MAG: hypothetical protein IBX45_12460 [Campylobacterales bacterium]|nr:hypothetical protein [Campylobacterales bacterium]
MNFCILTSSHIGAKKWIRSSLLGFFLTTTALFLFNFIVDPYNITSYNILNITQKLARDDRVEKVNYFATLPVFDTILIGSSRVYTIDPEGVNKYLGGTTYNFGVGTANIEDHLGILLYLKKLDKLPRRLIIGIDFYTLNPDIPPNQYFLKNRELNFLSFKPNEKTSYWSKFFTLDATRASWKTLKNHLKNTPSVSAFDKLGWSPRFFDDSNRDIDAEKIGVLNEIDKNTNLYSNFTYASIDPKRIGYYEKIREICTAHNIQLYLFITPLHPILVEKLLRNDTKKAIAQMDAYFSTFENFHNFLFDKEFNSNLLHFQGATHTTSHAGYQIIKRVLALPNKGDNPSSKAKSTVSN